MLATLRRLLLVSSGAALLSMSGLAQVSADLLAKTMSAAEQGDAKAQYSLGSMYDTGQGVTQNYAEAIRWYRLAADHGHAQAQNNLGSMYYNGQGVPPSYVEAYKWVSLAAAQGDSGAANNRDIVRGKMTPAQIAEGQKLSAAWKPKGADN